MNCSPPSRGWSEHYIPLSANSAEERRKARRYTTRLAKDGSDLCLLLDVLGLSEDDEADGHSSSEDRDGPGAR